MTCPLGSDELNKLRMFIGACSANPSILNMPQLDFVKEFVEKLGGKVPAAAEADGAPAGKCPAGEKAEEPEVKVEEDEEDDEPQIPEVELDNTGVIAPDNDEPQPMGDSSKEPTEEEIDQASDLRAQAASAFSERNFQEAIDLYTKAIELNPGNALFHAKRGQVYLKLEKPNACIRDCDKALELNCDSAAAYKYRGRAHRLLGNWETAAKDLRQACKLDFDEEADEWLKEVTPNAKKLEQHKIEVERQLNEKKLKEQQKRASRAQEANKKAREESARASAGGPNIPGFAGGLPPGFDDPEIQAAFAELQSNPASATKWMSNPKVMEFVQKYMGMGGMGGMPGMPGMRTPGAPKPDEGSAQPPPSAGKKPDFTDDGLD